ncbi:hypothetical protein ADK33_20780 [Streptomyces griseus subsp. rhodochrous]|nr:hypothetical protein ADK33_20780 [Streptomyces griseus subsp. rhodochrous]
MWKSWLPGHAESRRSRRSVGREAIRPPTCQEPRGGAPRWVASAPRRRRARHDGRRDGEAEGARPPGKKNLRRRPAALGRPRPPGVPGRHTPCTPTPAEFLPLPRTASRIDVRSGMRTPPPGAGPDRCRGPSRSW